MAGPLQGVRVIELPAIGPVPFLGMLLADLGAEVIRIDRLSPGPGWLMRWPAVRRWAGAPFARAGPAQARAARRWCCGWPRAATRSSRGSALASPNVSASARPRCWLATRAGLRPDDRLGPDGPLATTAGHDITYLALTGLLHGIGPAAGPPVPPINYVADFGGGAMFLATGLLAALLHARATGEGQVVDAAMIEGASYLGSMTRTFLSRGGWTDEREANMLDGGAPNYRCYECADGRYVAVGALEPQFWTALVTALGGDPSEVASPYEPDEWAECYALALGTFKTRTRDEWAEVFAAARRVRRAGAHPGRGARPSAQRGP